MCTHAPAALYAPGVPVDPFNPRSWCKAGAWGTLDGKIGKLTMDPDSDAEVKLKWADGSTR